MFKNAFPTKELSNVSNKINNPRPLPPQQSSPQKEDETVEKMRKWLLIGLTALVAGAAALLLVWRLILKFI